MRKILLLRVLVLMSMEMKNNLFVHRNAGGFGFLSEI